MKMAKVLIVDDDAVLREFLQKSLKRAGYDVRATDSKASVKRDEFDAVLSEIERPFSLDKLQRRLRLMGLTQAA